MVKLCSSILPGPARSAAASSKLVRIRRRRISAAPTWVSRTHRCRAHTPFQTRPELLALVVTSKAIVAIDEPDHNVARIWRWQSKFAAKCQRLAGSQTPARQRGGPRIYLLTLQVADGEAQMRHCLDVVCAVADLTLDDEDGLAVMPFGRSGDRFELNPAIVHRQA